MDKQEFRVLIKHCFLMKKNTVRATQWLVKYYGSYAPRKSTVTKWYAEFKRGCFSTEDAPRSGRPIEVVTPANFKKIHSIISNDHKAKLREIAAQTKISTERVGFILHEHLKMRKLCSYWVPRALTFDQKRKRVSLSKCNLEKFKHDSSEFMQRFVTMDETWIHYYMLNNKQKKLLAHIFWDAHGILFIDYHESKKTMNDTSYAALLDRLNDEIKKKRKKKTVLFHQNNPPIFSSTKSTEKLEKINFEVLPQPQYSPDLAPSDFYLFENLRKWLLGKRFQSNDDVQKQLDSYFNELSSEFYSKGVQMLEDRWSKCIAINGNFIEE